jgi:hypothetical protein
MKVVAILFVLVAAGVFVLVKFGGLADYDPAAQVEEFKKTVKPGEKWDAVLDKFPTKKMGWMTYQNLNPKGPLFDFAKDGLAAQIKQGSHADGFYLSYILTADDQYDVYCDAQGVVTRVERQMTMNDLTHGNNWKGPLNAGGGNQ